MILLNTISGESMYKKDLDIFYKYLSYLQDVGLDKELIKIFSSLYLPIPNQNPFSLVKTIPLSLKKEITYQHFKKEYKIKE